MIGALVNRLLLRGGVKLGRRRLALVAVGVILVTPLPYPAAMASIFLPGALGLVLDPVTYAEFMAPLPFSALASGVLSSLACLRADDPRSEARRRRDRLSPARRAGTPPHQRLWRFHL